MSERIIGYDPEPAMTCHPRWSDGEPILVGDEVNPSGEEDAYGLVSGVRHGEVIVHWALEGEDNWSEDDVRRPDGIQRVHPDPDDLNYIRIR